MKLNLILLLVCCLSFASLNAQRNCGSMDHLHQMMEKDPQIEKRMNVIEEATQKFLQNPTKAVNGTITIPVVVHVVYRTSAENISNSQINSQIQVLNEDFRRLNSDADNTWGQAADAEIDFCLATVDPNGNATSGITRTQTSVSSHGTNDSVKFDSQGGKNAWPASDYLNIWVCNIGGGILGYAQFPGGPASTDGVVNDYRYFGTNGTATAPFNLGRTMTHEVGHYLNLRHIWGDGGCNVDDFVSDTPTSDGPNYGCTPNHVSCSSTDMVQNYMDYSDDACMNLYTEGQKTRMRALFDTGGFRESLLNSPACGTANPPTCTDGIQNGNETGVDCGGPDCLPCQSGCNDNDVTLTLTLDNYPEETTWTITNSSGATLFSGGPYGNLPDGSVVTEDFCLADGCFDFNIFDSYGDGICCSYGNGSYSVTDGGGSVLASGGSFGSSESTNFCLGGSSGPTCTDGIQNGNETGVDCGGPDCLPCQGGGCTDVDIDDENYESGWGIWRDGGSDCRRSSRDSNYANSGNYCIRLRDNSGTASSTYSVNLNLAGFEEVTVDFTFYPRSMENGEDLFLEARTSSSGAWQELSRYISGTDFSNNSREFETVVVTGTFTSTTSFRFRCDASGNSDYIYLDDVVLTGCTNGTSRIIDESFISQLDEDYLDDNNELAIDEVISYPNPTSGILNIELVSEGNGRSDIMLMNTQGKLINKQSINVLDGLTKVSMDMSEFGAGVYFLHVVNDDEKIVKKIFVIE